MGGAHCSAPWAISMMPAMSVMTSPTPPRTLKNVPIRPIIVAAFAASCPASLASPAPVCTCTVHQSGKPLYRRAGEGVESDAPWRDFSASWASAVILLAAVEGGKFVS